MPFFNNSAFGYQELNILTDNLFNGEYQNGALVPPPGHNFMVTEVVHDKMEIEGGGALMVTEG